MLPFPSFCVFSQNETVYSVYYMTKSQWVHMVHMLAAYKPIMVGRTKSCWLRQLLIAINHFPNVPYILSLSYTPYPPLSLFLFPALLDHRLTSGRLSERACFSPSGVCEPGHCLAELVDGGAGFSVVRAQSLHSGDVNKFLGLGLDVLWGIAGCRNTNELPFSSPSPETDPTLTARCHLNHNRCPCLLLPCDYDYDLESDTVGETCHIEFYFLADFCFPPVASW